MFSHGSTDRGIRLSFYRFECSPQPALPIMELISIVLLAAGLILGFLIAYFKQKSSQALSAEEAEAMVRERDEARQTISRLEERNRNLAEQLSDTEQDREQAELRANETGRQLASLEADHRNLKERLAEQKKEMEALQERFKDEFENLANRILEEKSKKFTEQNKEKLDQLLKPLNEKMEAFKKKVEETHMEDVKGRSSLEKHLEHLMEMNKQLEKEASDLTKALKGDSKTQGSWGEVILERILERSGLTEGREYEKQVGVKTPSGGQRFLDVVVKLPDEKNIVIDSKVSLKDYERYTSAMDEEERQRALRQHVNSLRGHVKNLSGKNYQNLQGNSPDFVLLFVPIESAFGVALQHDNNLYYEAFEQNIVIVSPSTLLATLATIDSVWKQEYQNENAREIAARGGALHEKFVLFVESMKEIGQRIRQTQDSYDTAFKRLSRGRGNLVRQAEMLKKLGAKSQKTLPGELTERHILDEEE